MINSLLRTIVFISLLASVSCVSTQPRRIKVGTETKLINVDPNWMDYSTRSTIAKTDITADKLQGNWVAYFGCYKVEDTIQKGMALTIPTTISFTGNKFKRSKTGDDKEFSIMENKIINYSDDPLDSGIINMITSDSLIITWKYIAPKYKNDADKQSDSKKTYYTRYCFRKE